MPSKLSEFLMQYGGQLPSIVKQNRQIASDAETEKLRRAILEGQLSDADIDRQIKRQQLQAGEMSIEEKQAEIERNKQARQKISEAFTGFGKQKEIAGQATDIAEMEKSAGLKPLAEETAFQPKTMRQSAIDVGLPEYGDQDVVKQFQENYINPDEKTKVNKPFNLVGARLEYDTPENRNLAKMQIDDAFKSGTITEQMAKIAKADVDGGFAYDYNKSFREQGVEASLKRGVKVADEYALMAPRAETAAATGYSREIGGAQGRSDIPEKTGMTNVDPTTGEAFSNQQKNDAQFAIKLQRANTVLDQLAKTGFDESSIDKVLLSNVDQNGNIKVNALNSIKDPKLRKYAQAKLDFVMSTLRKESGAAISYGEYVGQSARYFPQAGDDVETLDQKRNARITEEATYQAAAGDAAMKYYQNKVKKVSEERPSPYKKKTEPAQPKLSARDQEAVDWAKNNPNDPRAKKILQIHGM